MEIISTKIPDVKIVTPKKFGDDRGFFSEIFNLNSFESGGIYMNAVQDNHSLSAEKGTLRGLHFQTPPFAQAKLVRVTRGAVLDVAVDIRKGSPTYGQHVSVELSAENWKQLYIPRGFAHGFCTLTANAEVLYKVDQFYSPENDTGLLWNDPDLGIDWPFTEEQLTLSDKDKVQPGFSQLGDFFTFG